MKRVALTLAALGVLGVGANRAFAEGALSYPMAAHVAAQYGVHHPGQNPAVIHQVNRYRHGYRGPHHYRHPGYRYRHGPVIVHPPVRRLPVMVVPAPIYRPYPYYYSPYYGLQYSTPRFSIGIGF